MGKLIVIATLQSKRDPRGKAILNVYNLIIRLLLPNGLLVC